MATEGGNEGSARGIPAIGSLLGIQRSLGAPLEDLRTIAEGMRLLPRLAESLEAIDARVESLDSEVRRMRVAVEQLNGQVGGMQAGIDALLAGVDRLADPLGEIGRTLHPLQRSRSRIGRISRRSADEELAEPEAEA